jgi:uncharacterized membrane protein
VFAIALTLLVLSLAIEPGLPAGELGAAVIELLPMINAFAISVALISIFWYSHHELLAVVQGVDGRFMVLNVAYLSLVVLIPFVQQVQGNYPFEPLAYVMFAAVLAALNFVDGYMRRYAYVKRLLTVQWTKMQYQVEMIRAAVLTCGFTASIPLSFLLVNWTVAIWVIMLPIDQLVAKNGRRIVAWLDR